MWSQSDQTQVKSSKSPKISLVARIVTLISLVISLAILKSNRVTWSDSGTEWHFDYTGADTYKYVLTSIIVGLAYNLLQTPFATYHAIRGKRIINNATFLKFEFYGDKVILCILATGVGAALGLTTYLKKYLLIPTSKRDDFCNMAFVSFGFLFIGFITSGISSLISSLAVSEGE